ncbi:MAG: DUF1015 family protein [Phycisphaerales bacterium]
MPPIHPFRAITYTSLADARDSGAGVDLSAFIAPPYDVLDEGAKAALLARSSKNIVAVDLPHLPAKELGPAAAYTAAAATYRSWLADGTLTRLRPPAIFCYRQTFQHHGALHQRTGFACTLDLVPFGPHEGGGMLPHEETFSGPKADRMALMKATGVQLSPIFGLYADDRRTGSHLGAQVCASRPPDASARTADMTLHEVWTITDGALIAQLEAALAGEDIFIADGHHRYTTQLNYVNELKLPPGHPARRCMFVLISMSDPGTVIGPTHRVLGGMQKYTWDAFKAAAAPHLRFEPIADTTDLAAIEAALNQATHLGKPRVAVYDFATRQAAIAVPVMPDPLKARFGSKPEAWRRLDVAFVQHILVEQICQPALNAGKPVQWAFPHTTAEVAEIGAGHQRGSGGGDGFVPQLAVLVRPTPLQAVREVSHAGELMPQKSTFFLPKLATGLFMNPLE